MELSLLGTPSGDSEPGLTVSFVSTKTMRGQSSKLAIRTDPVRAEMSVRRVEGQFWRHHPEKARALRRWHSMCPFEVCNKLRCWRRLEMKEAGWHSRTFEIDDRIDLHISSRVMRNVSSDQLTSPSFFELANLIRFLFNPEC
jgi:hypothetical protein